MKQNFDKYIQYIQNVVSEPSILDNNYQMSVEWFDEDWKPIGPNVREDMFKVGLIEYCCDGQALKLITSKIGKIK